MPRGVKGSGTARGGKSVDAKIAENDARIEALQAQLSEAKARRKELASVKSQSDLEAIQKIIHKSGLSPDELKDLIEEKQKF
jgi:predicted house-cleaning noncanonical NTP pyrophosphatase (MazG superfamily)